MTAQILSASGNIATKDRAVEDLEGRLGLVPRDVVAGLEDTGEGQQAVLFRYAADVRAVDVDFLVA